MIKLKGTGGYVIHPNDLHEHRWPRESGNDAWVAYVGWEPGMGLHGVLQRRMKELFLQYVQKRRQVMVWVKVVFVCYPVTAFFQPFLYMSSMNGENRAIVDYILGLPMGLDSWC